MPETITKKGMPCPRCGSKNRKCVGRYHPKKGGVRIRYFRCDGCRCRFSSIERVVGVMAARAVGIHSQA